MSLTESPSFKTFNKPLKAASVPDEAYVLGLTSLDNAYAASASSPSNEIFLFDKLSLRTIQKLRGHNTATTSIRTVQRLAAADRQLLLSSGKDGCVKAWDARSNSVAIDMRTSGALRPLLCCDASSDGLTVAAGTVLEKEDAFILYWDPRFPAAPLRTHGSTHSDDVTVVSFLTQSQSTQKNLLSASSDGLISTSNAEENDEDEAVLHVGNWSCSISQAGWICGPAGPNVWAASDMETFSTWSKELDPRADLDIRNPSVHTQSRTWVTDYLISCHNDTRSSGDPRVFVGSNEGDFALISSSDVYDAGAPWSLHRVWSEGHTDIVRSLLWDEENGVIISGGEDGGIKLWSAPPLEDAYRGPMEVDDAASPARKREWDGSLTSDADIEVDTKRKRR